MHREEGRLDGEGDEEPEEEPAPGLGVDGEPLEVAEQVGGLALLRRDHVETDHRGQQDQAAGELEHEELQRDRAAALAPEAADEEVGRDQRRLEDHVEQEHVGGAEDREREALERQRPRHERARTRAAGCVGLEPLGGEHERHEQHGEQHHQQAEAVDAQGVVDAERVDPGVHLLELAAAAAGVELQRGHDPEHEGGEETPRPTTFSRWACAPGRSATTIAPTIGSQTSRERIGKSLLTSSPPSRSGRGRRRRRAPTARRSGRSRSAACAAARRCRRRRWRCPRIRSTMPSSTASEARTAPRPGAATRVSLIASP